MLSTASNLEPTHEPNDNASENGCPVDIYWAGHKNQSRQLAEPNIQFGSWALDLIRVGRRLAEIAPEPPITLAMSLPNVSFAGPLIAAGFIARRSEQQFTGAVAHNLDTSDREQIFRELCSLHSGTPIVLRRSSGETVNAVFECTEWVAGEQWAKIRFQKTSKGAGSEFIRRENVHRVYFASDLDAEAAEGRIGRRVSVREGLAKAFIPDRMVLRHLITQSSTDCALIGVMRTILDELVNSVLVSFGSDDAPIKGNLQDIVRVKSHQSENKTSRAELFATKCNPNKIIEYNPSLAIFCSSGAYISRSAKLPMAHHVAILSPVERPFEDCVAALNDAFLNKLEEVVDTSWPLPRGVTGMAFLRR